MMEGPLLEVDKRYILQNPDLPGLDMEVIYRGRWHPGIFEPFTHTAIVFDPKGGGQFATNPAWLKET